MTRLASFLWALLTTGSVLGVVDLVKDGRAVSEIVIAEDAVQGVKLAAEELRKHLELIFPGPRFRSSIHRHRWRSLPDIEPLGKSLDEVIGSGTERALADL